jgi:tetratricopeptide (TPR) repeat protein
LNGLGALEVATDRPAEALPLFERALALDPELHEVRLNRAIALELAGDRPAAITAYREFLSASAGDPEFESQRRAAERLLAQLTRGG